MIETSFFSYIVKKSGNSMIENLGKILRDNLKLEIFMSLILLMAMTAIACNMDKVAEKENSRERVQRENKANGKVVVIDPGHGGIDPGKVGVSGTEEKNVNLEIAMSLRETLIEGGFDVVMTRTEDEVLKEGEKFSKLKDLKTRCEIINNTYLKNSECVLVSIHQNSFTKDSVHGAQCFYYQRSEKSMALANILQEELNHKINVENPKKSKPNDSYYMLINSKCPGIILECGFLSNPQEEQKLTNSEYQKELAKIIESGIREYFCVE